MPYCKKHPDDIKTERGFNGAELRSERRSATGISSATVPGGNSATVPLCQVAGGKITKIAEPQPTGIAAL